MNKRPFASFQILVVALIASCAGGPQLLNEPPEWVSAPLESGGGVLAFRGEGSDEIPVLAKEGAIDDLTDKVLLAMNLGDESRWTAQGAADVNAFRLELESAVRTPGEAVLDGFAVVRIAGWKDSGRMISFAVDITWDENAFAAKANELADATGVTSAGYRELEARAKAAEENGNLYEASLIWAKAAGMAQENGNPSGYRQALRQAGLVLQDLDYALVSVPAQAYVGARPSSPVVFAVEAGGRPVGNAEFVLTYPTLSREGSPTTGSVRMPSDGRGHVSFLPPEIRYPGLQTVSIAPSAEPILEYLDGSVDSNTDRLIATLENPKAEAVYEAFDPIRTIPTGILILETDLAGNPLGSAAAAAGLLDDLRTDGFNVVVMDLDPREMMDRTERALLRDIKADVRFSSRYDRVIHGTVALESFEQDGDGFTVRVSGTLTLSDIDRQVRIYRSTISKTSRAGDGQQAIAAAFRQLGRSFAAELIAQAPK